MSSIEEGRRESASKVMKMGVSSQGRAEQVIVAARIVDRGNLEEEIRKEGRDTRPEELVVDISRLRITESKISISGTGRKEGGVTGEEMSVEEGKTITSV
jgi:hypothetical protein